MSHWGMVPRTGLASFLMHLCAALVDRVAFPGSVRRASRVRRKVEKAKLLALFLMHLCAALVNRDAFFGRNFGAVFEHAKTLIREEPCTAMSHCEMTPRAGFGSAVWARAQWRAVAEEVRRGCKVGAMGCGGVLR